MSPSRPTLIAATACLLLAANAAAFAAPAPKKQGFEAYALLRTRNVFDPERQPGATAAAPTPNSQATPGHADFAALTGIMITSEKPLAFFSGSRSEYSGVLPVGSTIAGARITRIGADTIEIERSGKRTLINVGQTVPLNAASVPTAAPTTTAAPDPSASTNAAPTGATTTPSSPSASAPAPADREALIRRMMEKRQQELK